MRARRWAEHFWSVAGAVSIRVKVMGIVIGLILMLGVPVTLVVHRGLSTALERELEERGGGGAGGPAGRGPERGARPDRSPPRAVHARQGDGEEQQGRALRVRHRLARYGARPHVPGRDAGGAAEPAPARGGRTAQGDAAAHRDRAGLERHGSRPRWAGGRRTRRHLDERDAGDGRSEERRGGKEGR